MYLGHSEKPKSTTLTVMNHQKSNNVCNTCIELNI